MKIVIAEKVSPAAEALLKEESRWEVVTAEQINAQVDGGLSAIWPTRTRSSCAPPSR